jgi:hypothetical protein
MKWIPVHASRYVPEQRGYACTLATDTTYFVAALGSAITLILPNLMLPDTGGVELLRVLARYGYDGRVVPMSDVDPRVLATAEAMVKALGMRVVAVGVKIPPHLDLRKAHACNGAQSYLFSRPLAVAGLLVWLGQHSRRI